MIFLLAIGIVRSGLTPFVVFPKLDGNRVQAVVSYPDGTPSQVTKAAVKQLENAALELEKEYQTGRRLAVSGTPAVDRRRSRGPFGSGPDQFDQRRPCGRRDVGVGGNRPAGHHQFPRSSRNGGRKPATFPAWKA